MNVSKREKLLLLGTLAVLGILALDRYALTPYLEEQDLLQTERDRILADILRGQKLFAERKQLAPRWSNLIKTGLKSDPAEAEGQLLHALRDWAGRSGLTLSSIKPDRQQSKEPLKEIHLQTNGTGSMEAVAKLLWEIQSAPFPLKVTELQIGSRIDGNNDLTVQLKLATLYYAPETRVAKADSTAGGGVK